MEVSSKMLLHHDHMGGGGLISKLVRYSGFPKARSPNIDHPDTMILLLENPPKSTQHVAKPPYGSCLMLRLEANSVSLAHFFAASASSRSGARQAYLVRL